MKWYKSVLLIMAIPLIVGISACGKKTTGNKTASGAHRAYPPVSATHVSIGEVYDEQVFNAYSQYLTKDNVRAPISGYLEKVLTHVGETVTKGQLLFSMRTQESVALAKMHLKNDTIMNYSGLINVYAPKSGVINSVVYQQGAFVQQGEQLASLIATGSVIFIMNVPFENTGVIKKGIHLKIELPGSKTVSATVGDQLPLPNARAQVQSYILKPDSILLIPENLNATVRVKIAIKADAQRITKSAVLTNETQTDFWVMKLINDTTAVRVDINKGLETDSLVEIVSPLFDKQTRILSSGQFGLGDTARVSLTNEMGN